MKHRICSTCSSQIILFYTEGHRWNSCGCSYPLIHWFCSENCFISHSVEQHSAINIA